MTTNGKIALLEETLDLETGKLKEDTVLSSLVEWDSMSKLSVIVMMDDEFSKTISGEQVRGFKTVKDILDVME